MAAKSRPRRAEPDAATGVEDLMTPEQERELRQLAYAAFEPEAFGRQLTRGDAAQRIAMLRAKLKLMDEPPHTL